MLTEMFKQGSWYGLKREVRTMIKEMRDLCVISVNRQSLVIMQNEI